MVVPIFAAVAALAAFALVGDSHGYLAGGRPKERSNKADDAFSAGRAMGRADSANEGGDLDPVVVSQGLDEYVVSDGKAYGCCREQCCPNSSAYFSECFDRTR